MTKPKPKRACSTCGVRASFVLFHDGTERPRAFACVEHAEGATRAALAPWLAALEAYQERSQRRREAEHAAYLAREAARKKRERRAKKKPTRKKGRKMGVTLHAIAEVAYAASTEKKKRKRKKGDAAAYWDLFAWDLNKAYEVMIALDEHAHDGWPEDASARACELEKESIADAGQQWATLEELRALLPHVEPIDDELDAGDAEHADYTLHLRAMIAALEIFAAGAGVPVRVLFYRC